MTELKVELLQNVAVDVDNNGVPWIQFRWYRVVRGFEREWFAAYCPLGKGVAKLTPKQFRTAVITDCWIHNHQCEESQRCLCLTCPFNCTDHDSFDTNYVVGVCHEQFATLVRLARDITEGIR